MMMKMTVLAVMVLAAVSVRGEQAVGSMAPSFSLSDVKGPVVTLVQQRGKVVLLNFWATWCGPCKAEMPILMSLQKVHGAAGLVVLGVSMDEEGASVITPWLQKTKFVVDGAPAPMNFPILIGTPQVATAYGELEALTATFVIDRQGKVVQRIDGPIKFSDMDRTVRPLLAGK